MKRTAAQPSPIIAARVRQLLRVVDVRRDHEVDELDPGRAAEKLAVRRFDAHEGPKNEQRARLERVVLGVNAERDRRRAAYGEKCRFVEARVRRGIVGARYRRDVRDELCGVVWVALGRDGGVLVGGI